MVVFMASKGIFPRKPVPPEESLSPKPVIVPKEIVVPAAATVIEMESTPKNLSMLFLAALLGGLIAGLSTAFVVCCCFANVLTGALAAAALKVLVKQGIGMKWGAITGAVSGLIAAVTSLVLAFILGYMKFQYLFDVFPTDLVGGIIKVVSFIIFCPLIAALGGALVGEFLKK